MLDDFDARDHVEGAVVFAEFVGGEARDTQLKRTRPCVAILAADRAGDALLAQVAHETAEPAAEVEPDEFRDGPRSTCSPRAGCPATRALEVCGDQ